MFITSYVVWIEAIGLKTAFSVVVNRDGVVGWLRLWYAKKYKPCGYWHKRVFRIFPSCKSWVECPFTVRVSQGWDTLAALLLNTLTPPSDKLPANKHGINWEGHATQPFPRLQLAQQTRNVCAEIYEQFLYIHSLKLNYNILMRLIIIKSENNTKSRIFKLLTG